MHAQVWCVFQRLPDERCPTLAAVCVSRAVAERVADLGRQEHAGESGGASEWSVSAWTVLDSELSEMEEIGHISHVLDPMREGLALPPDGQGRGEPET
jgi:hypothetical protein